MIHKYPSFYRPKRGERTREPGHVRFQLKKNVFCCLIRKELFESDKIRKCTRKIIEFAVGMITKTNAKKLLDDSEADYSWFVRRWNVIRRSIYSRVTRNDGDRNNTPDKEKAFPNLSSTIELTLICYILFFGRTNRVQYSWCVVRESQMRIVSMLRLLWSSAAHSWLYMPSPSAA